MYVFMWIELCLQTDFVCTGLNRLVHLSPACGFIHGLNQVQHGLLYFIGYCIVPSMLEKHGQGLLISLTSSVPC